MTERVASSSAAGHSVDEEVRARTRPARKPVRFLPIEATAAELLNSLFAAPVAVAIAAPSADSVLLPDEQAIIGHAVPARRLEFATVRACARSALRQLGCPDASSVAIPVGADRAPIWPSGYLGSLSHCKDLCAAVAARQSSCRALGIDVEAWVEIEAAMIELICTADEIERFSSDAILPLPQLALLSFSAKEAFYKAYHPLTKQFLEFGDLSVRLIASEADGGGFAVQLRPSLPMSGAACCFVGSWRRLGDHVFTGVTCL